MKKYVMYIAIVMMTVANAYTLFETGFLRTDSGAPVTNNVSMQFMLYRTASGGSPSWSSDAATITVDNGSYSVSIENATNNLTGTIISDMDDFYLEHLVGGSALSPRKQLGFAARSILAGTALTANTLGGKIESALDVNSALTSLTSTTANQALTANFSSMSLVAATGNIALTANVALQMDSMYLQGAIQVLTDNPIIVVSSNGNVGIGIQDPGSALHINGPITLATSAKSVTYQLTDMDSVLFVSTVGSDRVMQLPAPSAATIGRSYYIYKVDGAGGNVNITSSGGGTVNGDIQMTSQWECIHLIGYTATEWIGRLY